MKLLWQSGAPEHGWSRAPAGALTGLPMHHYSEKLAERQPGHGQILEVVAGTP